MRLPHCLSQGLFLLSFFAASSQRPASRQTVEQGLIPFVPVKGMKGWSLADRMKHYEAPGLSLAVVKNGKLAWAEGYGLADTTTGRRVNTRTMFSAGSISKLVMAVAALRLVDQGKIHLDSPVNNYLRRWKIADNDFTRQRPVTLRMLLSHSAGSSQSSYFGFSPDQPLPTLLDVLQGKPVAQTRAVGIVAAPGKQFNYSGGGSMIAQLALEEVTGQDFETLMQTLLFQPLNMRNTTMAQPVPERWKAQCAWAYSRAGWFKGMPYVYPQQAAAGLYSTPSDLALLMMDLQKSLAGKGGLLSRQAARTMVAPQFEVSDGSYHEQIGVGPFLIERTGNQQANGKYFEFTGVNAGFLAYFISSVESGDGAVIMLNSGDDVNGLGKELRRAVAAAYQWPHFLPDTVVPKPLTARQMQAVEGRYRMGADEVMTLKQNGNWWVQTINGGERETYFVPTGGDSLVITDYNIKARLVRNAQGQVVGIQNQWQQQPMLRMADTSFSPGELLAQGQWAKAQQAYAAMGLNEYQLTYLIYDKLNAKNFRPEAVEALLQLAGRQFPNSAIVQQRWADFYVKTQQPQKALDALLAAQQLEPLDAERNKAIVQLQARLGK